MGTMREEMERGCLSKVLPDEPIFVLLARDAQAPARVRDWAMQRRADITLGRKPLSDMALIDEAHECAHRMEEWRKHNDGKWRTGLFAEGEGPESEEDLRRGMLGKGA